MDGFIHTLSSVCSFKLWFSTNLLISYFQQIAPHFPHVSYTVQQELPFHHNMCTAGRATAAVWTAKPIRFTEGIERETPEVGSVDGRARRR